MSESSVIESDTTRSSTPPPPPTPKPTRPVTTRSTITPAANKRETSTNKTSSTRLAEAAVADGVRGTVEYRAAWDVELWKAIQASRLRQQLEEQKKKALADLAKFIKSREQQAIAGIELKERELARREQRVVEEEKQMEKRKWRLTEMEKDLRLARQQLAEARRRAELEAKAEVQRAKEDAAHAVALQEQRVIAAEAQTKRIEERLQQQQREYLSLSEEFHRFRSRELSSQPEKTSTVEGRMRAEFALEQQEQQEKLERRYREREQQNSQRCRELEEENKKLTALATKRKEQLRRSMEEVAQLKLQNSALEERLQQQYKETLTGDSKKEGKKIKAKLQENMTMSQGAVKLDVDVACIAKEIERLRRERRSIVEGSAGALDEESDVVRCMDAKITDMIERLHASGRSVQLVSG